MKVPAVISATYSLPLKSSCLDTTMILYAPAPLSIITDLAIPMLPMPTLISLNLLKKERVVVILLFAEGGL